MSLWRYPVAMFIISKTAKNGAMKAKRRLDKSAGARSIKLIVVKSKLTLKNSMSYELSDPANEMNGNENFEKVASKHICIHRVKQLSSSVKRCEHGD